MKVAVFFGRWSLSFRKTLDLATCRTDPRGLTGSEVGCLRIAQELAKLDHDVTLYSVTDMPGKDWVADGATVHVRDIDDQIAPCDVMISINEPDLLRMAPDGAFRVCCFWLNDVSFTQVSFDEHVDLFLSPSAPHLRQVMTNPEWRKVEKSPEFPDGKAQYVADPAKWMALELGCDIQRFDTPGGEPYTEPGMATMDIYITPVKKIPGRVIYASSPDRGLHHLLGAWPEIRRAVPHATLHIFYRLEPWLRGFDSTPYFPPIEPLRDRAAYAEECLRRFREHGDMGVTLRDSVSRETIEREMAAAEVLAYPCSTTTWSEGFSCTVLEACAARACPIISDCDALGEVYAPLRPVPREPGWVKTWTGRVIEALAHPEVRSKQNDEACALASKLTWKIYAEKLMKEVEERRA